MLPANVWVRVFRCGWVWAGDSDQLTFDESSRMPREIVCDKLKDCKDHLASLTLGHSRD